MLVQLLFESPLSVVYWSNINWGVWADAKSEIQQNRIDIMTAGFSLKAFAKVSNKFFLNNI
jgi:hypothetical protein